jgi:TRAP-type C4-dicarboxylate transport system permease small subunit
MLFAEGEGGRWNRSLSLFTFFVSGVLLLTISLMVTVDVIMRYVFLSPISGILEIERMMMPYVCFCAFAYAFVHRVHVRMSLVTSRLPSRARRINEMIADLIALTGCGIITYGAWIYFLESLGIKEVMASGGDFWIPLWLGKMGFPIGITLFSFVIAWKLVGVVRNKG